MSAGMATNGTSQSRSRQRNPTRPVPVKFSIKFSLNNPKKLRENHEEKVRQFNRYFAGLFNRVNNSPFTDLHFVTCEDRQRYITQRWTAEVTEQNLQSLNNNLDTSAQSIGQVIAMLVIQVIRRMGAFRLIDVPSSTIRVMQGTESKTIYLSQAV